MRLGIEEIINLLFLLLPLLFLVLLDLLVNQRHRLVNNSVQSPKEMPTYVCFKALLTVTQALELKEFFERRNIEFSRI